MSSHDRGIDRLLDRLIVPGYSRLGFALRERQWSDDDPHHRALTGCRALVTGAGGGIGEAIALGLARLGAQVHVVVRSADRATEAVERITSTLRHEGLSALLEVEVCDVSDMSSVRSFAADFTQRVDSLDVVIHNAGVLPPERTESVDGHELTVATHVLGPILMTELLLPALRESPMGARVVLMASGGMYAQRLPSSDPDYLDAKYRGATAYARSKRMQVELAPVLSRRWANDGVSVYAMHPGWVNTPGITSSLPGFSKLMQRALRTSQQGADTAVWLSATSPAPPSGGFWHDRALRPRSYFRTTQPSPLEVGQLWMWVAGTLKLS